MWKLVVHTYKICLTNAEVQNVNNLRKKICNLILICNLFTDKIKVGYFLSHDMHRQNRVDYALIIMYSKPQLIWVFAKTR